MNAPNSPPAAESALIARARSGDPEAFEALMASRESLVWRVCWHYTGNREDAADCGQETMLRLWRSLDSFRFECSFDTWVYRVASSCCLDFLRKAGRRKTISLEPLAEAGFDPPDAAPGTEEQALRRDEHARIRQAILDLPEEQRDALLLTQLEGKSYGEAAQLLEVSEGTVKSRVSRARDRLKFLFSSGEPSPEPYVQKKEGPSGGGSRSVSGGRKKGGRRS